MSTASPTPTLVGAPSSRVPSVETAAEKQHALAGGDSNGASTPFASSVGAATGDIGPMLTNDTEKGPERVYEGNGSAEAPFVVRWAEGDPANPFNWSTGRRWAIVAVIATCTLVIAFGSSVYAGGIAQMVVYFGVSQEVIILGLSLYVLGFALGPLLWAPFSELYGRRIVFIATYFPFFVLHIGCALARNIETLLICRFLAGFFGSSPLTNSGGVISDCFNASERALALSMFALAPFAGPVVGPVVGGYLGQSASWRYLFWLLTAFSGVLFVLGSLVPETYAPILLRRRALQLSAQTGQHYISFLDLAIKADETLVHKLKVNCSRPFLLLVREPIVALFAVYAAFVYGVLYCLFGAYPIIFQKERGWTAGAAGLPFLGVGFGMLIGIIINVWSNKKYVRDLEKNGGTLPPEARLPLCCVGGVALPIGLFWFAWTVQPSVHYMVPILGSVPFGLGMVLLFLSMTNYMDAYLTFAASALAANAVLRALCGAAFPTFTSQMFGRLGTNWALTLIAFISLVLTPVPFVFLKYGARIRAGSTFAPGHKPPQLSKPATRHEQDIAEEVRMADLAQVESVVEDARARGHHA